MRKRASSPARRPGAQRGGGSTLVTERDRRLLAFVAEHRIVLQLSDNDPKKQSLVISVAYNLLKLYDPDKVAIEVVTFGPGIDLLFPDNANRQRIESLVAQGVKFDICLNTVDTIERDTGKRPQYIPAATPVQVGVGQILSLTENGYTLVKP